MSFCCSFPLHYWFRGPFPWKCDNDTPPKIHNHVIAASAITYHLYIKTSERYHFLQQVLSSIIAFKMDFIPLHLRGSNVWNGNAISHRWPIVPPFTRLFFLFKNLIPWNVNNPARTVNYWCLINISLKTFTFSKCPFFLNQSFFNTHSISHLSNTAVGPAEDPWLQCFLDVG